MSIFDSIQTAEKKAEQMRAAASEQVNSLIEETRIASERKTEELYSQAKTEEEKINAEISELIRKKESEINALYQKRDDLLSQKAVTNSDDVIAFIIGKVFEV